MAVTIDASAKGADANAYDTLANTETYIDGVPDDAVWDAATDDAKNRAIKTATDRLEQLEYRGGVTTTTQRLKWPRNGLTDEDGRTYDSDAVPRPIKEAMYELAFAIVKGEYGQADSGLEGFKHVQVGPLQVTPRHGKRPDALPSAVRRLISRFVVNQGEYSARLVRG